MFCFKPEARRALVVAAGAIPLSLMLIQCDEPSSAPPPAKTDAPQAVVLPTAPIGPATVASLSRGDLVSAAGQAASAYASGEAPQGPDPLVGRSFAVRVPFGCQGPSAPVEGAAPDGLARWNWGADHKTLQISLAPGDWTGSALTATAGPQADPPPWEAVEGFWVPRPWLASETCPTVQGDPLQTALSTPSPQSVGIAAVFEAGGSRIGRRNGRAYTFTVRSQNGEVLTPPAGGYRLLLEGRVVGFPGGRAIRCRAPGPDHRPVCVTAVQLDKVAFEDATGGVISEWRPG